MEVVPATPEGSAEAPQPSTPAPAPSPVRSAATLDSVYSVIRRLRARLRHAVKGRDDVIDLLVIALLADGHVLLEDYPGSGKTTLAKALGDAIHDEAEHEDQEGLATFRRIQFTPDLLPSDITGVAVFDANQNTFQFRRGPIFSYVLLGDEINRTSPKVQSAMLEAMAEKQVTVDNVSYSLNDLFFVIATQNPRDLAGTYPLPVAQLDRFLFKIRMDFIDRDSELAVLQTLKERRSTPGDDAPRVKRRDILEARRQIETGVHVSPVVHTCLVDTARAIRSSPKVVQGVSTRSLVLLLPALQAAAALKERDFVTGEDIQWLAPFVFSHRMDLSAGVDDTHAVVAECLKAPLETLTRSTLRK